MTPGYNLRVTPELNESVTSEPILYVADSTKYDVTVWFDLDETLFIVPINEERRTYCSTKSNLTKTSIYLMNTNIDCYLIFKQRTAELFKFLCHDNQKSRVRVAFITAGVYFKEQIIPFLEREYELVPGTLRKSIFINGLDLGDRNTAKGEKLYLLRSETNLFQANEEFVLVDDNHRHIASVKKFGFTGITATHEIDSSDSGIKYLEKVQQTVVERLAVIGLLQLSSSSSSTHSTKPSPA